jgi:hypothetical protein
VLSGLELRGVCGQEDQMQPVGHVDLPADCIW